MGNSREQFITDQKNLYFLKGAKGGAAMTLLCSVICIAFFWRSMDHTWLLIWGGANILFAFIRLILLKRIKYVTGKKNFYFNLFVYCIPVSGLLFSSITFYYLNETDLTNFYIFSLYLVGMVNGGNLSCFIYTRIAVAYMIGVIASPLIVFWVHDPKYLAAILIFLVTFSSFSTLIIFKIKKQVIERFGYMFDSDLAEKGKQISMARLVVGMAHEINTPLGLTVTYTSFMKDKVISLLAKFKNSTMRKSEFEDGMNEKEVKHFFDPFYRGNVKLENKGLGGHILYNTVTQVLNGTIVCGSQVNGCEFIIEFPVNITEYDSLSHLYVH